MKQPGGLNVRLCSESSYSAPDRAAEYCDERVCLCVRARVCLFAIIFSELHVRSSSIFLSELPMAVARFSSGGLGMLCTSVFMDDVIFVHKARLLDVATQLKRSAHASLSLAVHCAQ